MDRIIDYIIGKEADGLRVEQFLRRKGYSRQNLSAIKRMPESILVNGAPRYMNQPLREGDLLRVGIRETGVSEKIPPVPLPLDIVYEDGDIIVVNKPAGMPIHPSVNNYTNTMANALAWYYKEQGKPFIFRCSNRLDRDTSGLTVVAKHLVSAGILSAMTADKTLGREYLAIVSGHVTPPAGTVRAPLARSGTSIVERKVDFEHGEEAVTHYETIGLCGPHSLVRLKLETGRTHQIRVHMQYLGYPLIGDYLYNPDMKYISRQALHSHRLSFPHPMTGEPMEFTAPLPEDMKRVLRVTSSSPASQG
ncbi:RluA family pseudouridine synthase [Faecalicatena contorta]|uniref:Pseudouridine synthase n=1 Tax=Faecalicatena fissicatena TaxID=290055 RepID=A0ABS2E901_9FIRM|nr:MULTISPECIES: RluA family pseudouridine synthase [Faecalicatena]MBM6686622.1 RluA family pseudouridine synthase [Faecalicatena contorta]MBM6711938.1 RluA family pseudouridine synthase [Faecalicatena contorta]MBM6738087.1 RluA family pseudouridine synthase [Faecalicatena fissicatena]